MSDAPRPSSGERWIIRETERGPERYCRAHDHVFAIGEVCHACTTDPGPRIDVIAALVVDREGVTAEADVQAVSRMLRRRADELLEGTGLEISLGLKAIDGYLKAMRLWREMHTERLQIESDERLVEHDRRMAGLRGSN